MRTTPCGARQRPRATGGVDQNAASTCATNPAFQFAGSPGIAGIHCTHVTVRSALFGQTDLISDTLGVPRTKVSTESRNMSEVKENLG